MNREQYSILTLSLVFEIGPRRFQSLMEYFGTAEAVLNASEADLKNVEDINSDIACKIRRAGRTDDAAHEIELAQKLGVRIITCIDPQYPETLKNLYDWPQVIYVKGEIKLKDSWSVAVVGTRRPTNYGTNVASKFGRELAQHDITTVSGLARGIDTEVHKATVKAGGRTMAVLGNGLNRHYPPENRQLEDKIMHQGALISEFPLNCAPDKQNFPRRNRLISGLALATVVVEADIKSGALITAKCSLDQGKDVFAVPGPIFSKYSQGSHYLIKSGARLVENVGEIIDEIAPLTEWIRKKEQQRIYKQEDKTLLDNKSGEILNILAGSIEGVSIDFLAQNLGYTVGELSSGLLNLEMKGLIRSLPGKVYIKNQ